MLIALLTQFPKVGLRILSSANRIMNNIHILKYLVVGSSLFQIISDFIKSSLLPSIMSRLNLFPSLSNNSLIYITCKKNLTLLNQTKSVSLYPGLTISFIMALPPLCIYFDINSFGATNIILFS